MTAPLRKSIRIFLTLWILLGSTGCNAVLKTNLQDVSVKDQPFWQAGHEARDLREWEAHGGFVKQRTGTYQIVHQPAHRGNSAVALTIDTSDASITTTHAAYLFYWDPLPEEAYYFSAWYYVPSNVKPGDWWNIWQWKSTDDGNSDHSQAMATLNINPAEGGLKLGLYIRQEDDNHNRRYNQEIVRIPTDQWFHLEAYYKKAQDHSGQIIVWQDEVQIYELSGIQTVLSDGTLFWSINNYTDAIEPNPFTIYVDDAAISQTRIGSIFK